MDKSRIAFFIIFVNLCVEFSNSLIKGIKQTQSRR